MLQHDPINPFQPMAALSAELPQLRRFRPAYAQPPKGQRVKLMVGIIVALGPYV